MHFSSCSLPSIRTESFHMFLKSVNKVHKFLLICLSGQNALITSASNFSAVNLERLIRSGLYKIHQYKFKESGLCRISKHTHVFPKTVSAFLAFVPVNLLLQCFRISRSFCDTFKLLSLLCLPSTRKIPFSKYGYLPGSLVCWSQ